VDGLADALTQVAAQFSEQPFRMLVVDSIMGLFRVDYQGRGELSERQQKVGAVMSRLIKIANECAPPAAATAAAADAVAWAQS
jgi:meiotic recombination protein DMC1